MEKIRRLDNNTLVAVIGKKLGNDRFVSRSFGNTIVINLANAYATLRQRKEEHSKNLEWYVDTFVAKDTTRQGYEEAYQSVNEFALWLCSATVNE